MGRGQVKPQQNKVKSIRTWPRPTTKKVRTFLGLMGYYHQYIPHFATTAATLRGAMEKNRPNQFWWNNSMEKAFQTFKWALRTYPVLATPDFSRKFVLQTDAFEVGIGAVLSQIQEHTEHPITYISHKLLKHERNYATVEKEGLAIKWALQKLQYYLLGREFILIILSI